MLRQIAQLKQAQGHCYDPINKLAFRIKDGQLYSTLIGSEQSREIKVGFNKHSTQNLVDYIPRLLVISGNVLMNTQGTLLTNMSNQQSIVRSNIHSQPGTNFVWQFYAPNSLYNLNLGICRQTSPNKYEYILFEFVSSTPRTVTFLLQDTKISVWVNGTIPQRNSNKTIQNGHWYPCAKIRSEGNSLIFNPFGKIPNSKISIYNPFNSHDIVQAPPEKDIQDQIPRQHKENGYHKFSNLIQLNSNKFLLVTDDNYAKVIHRNPNTNKFVFPRLIVTKDHISHLLNQKQYSKLKECFSRIIETGNNKILLFAYSQVYSIDYILKWVEYMIKILDKYDQTNYQIFQILLKKLILLKINYPEKVQKRLTNPIYASELDRQNYHYSEQYLTPQNQMIKIDSSLIKNQVSFKLLDGKIISYVSNYLAIVSNKKFSIFSLINIVQKVKQFSQAESLNNNKSAITEAYQQKDTDIFKDRNEGPSIYKILANCLNGQSNQTKIVISQENKKLYLKQLIKDYQIPQQEAIQALEFNRNIEQALVWLAQGGIEKSKIQKQKQSKKQIQSQIVTKASILQIKNPKIPILRLVVHIDDKIYLLGLRPNKTHQFMKKLQKGYLNLSTFSYSNKISETNTQNWYQTIQHPQITILDFIQVNSIHFLVKRMNQKQQDQINVILNEDGLLLRKNLYFKNQKIFTNQCSIHIAEEAEVISEQFIDTQSLQRTSLGQIYWPESQKTQKYRQGTILLIFNKLFSNVDTKFTDNLSWNLKISPGWSLNNIKPQQEKDSHWLAMIVESGPPGCNMNYPICSILYPRSPFLANYPYSLKLRHLHDKYMRIRSVTIERLSKFKTANEVKQGHIYFTNDCGNFSKNYEFIFKPDQQSLQVIINQEGYWKYMVIVPIYTQGKKMPYQIGFVGAKGDTIQQQIYQQLLIQSIQKSICFENIKKYSIQHIQSLGGRILKCNAIVNHKIVAKNYQIKDKIFQQCFDIHWKLNCKSNSDQFNKYNFTQKIDVDQFIQDFLKLRPKQSSFLKSIIKNRDFTFAEFNNQQIRQFIDVSLSFNQHLKVSEYSILLEKIVKTSELGRKYLEETFNGLGEGFPIFKSSYLNLILNYISDKQAEAILRGLIKKIPQFRSKEYKQLRQQNIPYLLYEQNHYSQQYFNQIENKQKKINQIYSDRQIKTIKFIVIRQQHLRKIIIDLSHNYHISYLILRFDRTEFINKMHIQIYQWKNGSRKLLKYNHLHQHNWIQITKNPYKKQVQSMFNTTEQRLDSLGIYLDSVECRYLEIELFHTLTGFSGDAREIENVPFNDIIPQIYGSKMTYSDKVSGEDEKSMIFNLHQNYFSLGKDQLFLLSKVNSTNSNTICLNKYTANHSDQFYYYEAVQQNVGELEKVLTDKLAHKDFESAVTIHKKIMQHKKFTRRISLDYIYTFIVKILKRMDKNKYIIQKDLAQNIAKIIIEEQIGPIQSAAFKAISPYVDLLIRNLHYIKGYTPVLENIELTQSELKVAMDSKNIPLCQTLTNIIIKSIPYNNKWVEVVLNLTQVTKNYKIAINYLLQNQSWYQNFKLLKYLSEIPLKQTEQILIPTLTSKQLCQYVLYGWKNKISMNQSMLIDKLMTRKDKYIEVGLVQLMLMDKHINWNNLLKASQLCPQSVDFVYQKFLSSDPNSIVDLARKQRKLLYDCGKSQKYQKQFTNLLSTLYNKNLQIFIQVIYNLPETIKSLDQILLKNLVQFLNIYCNIGGPQGASLLNQKDILNLFIANKLAKLIKIDKQKPILIQDQLIRWYLHNSCYEQVQINPIFRSSGVIHMKEISESVLDILNQASIGSILRIFNQENQKLRSKDHFYCHNFTSLSINRINSAVSDLLSKSITPQRLSEVLTKKGQFKAIVDKLNETCKQINKNKQVKSNPPKESQLCQYLFAYTTKKQVVKDWQTYKQGASNKAPLVKIPATHGKLQLNYKTEGECISQQKFILTKFIIGFNIVDSQDKNNILPSSVDLYGGEDQSSLVKLAELKAIQDQHFLQYGVKVYGVNFNHVCYLPQISNHIPCKVLEIELGASMLPSVSDVLENYQRNKKGAFYGVSFLSVFGYGGQQQFNLSTTPIYSKLLSFLTEPSYKGCLQNLMNLDEFKQIFNKFIQSLAEYLPNETIEKLLISISNQGGQILDEILKSSTKTNISKLLYKLLTKKISLLSLQKCINYIIKNCMNQSYVNMICQCLKLTSYSLLKDKISQKIYINLQELVNNYYKENNIKIKQNYKKLITVISRVQNIVPYQILTLTKNIWKDKIDGGYLLLSGFVSENKILTNWFIEEGKAWELAEECKQTMNKINSNNHITLNLNDQNVTKVHNIISLLTSLSTRQEIKDFLINKNIPLDLMNLLANEQSLIVKYPSVIMKLFILFFQNTCIDSLCQQPFNQQLIKMMQKLPGINSIHHNYFIHQFFFPLINAYRGIPVSFGWKGINSNQYYINPTNILEIKPIKANNKVIQYNGKYYNLGTDTASDFIIINKDKQVIGGKKSNSWFKIINNIQQISQAIPLTEDLQIYQQSYKQGNLLTNQTLIRSGNPTIFGKQYLTNLPIDNSTERVYFLPIQITLTDLLTQINICGYRPNSETIKNIKIYSNGLQLSPQTKISQISKQTPLLLLEIEAQQLFKYTSIQKIVQDSQKSSVPFIPQNTVFKTFQRLKGLQKMIKVMKSCVTNWKNQQQSKAWLQYLHQLESFSCFPIFSSIYMAKQDNVELLFNLLLGLPDKQDNAKWTALQKKSVKFLYEIIKDVFIVTGQQANIVRKHALESHFYATMLQRLHLVTKQIKRSKNLDQEKQEHQEEDLPSLQKKDSQEQYKKKILTKKKGIGYGHDGLNNNQKWDLTGQQQIRKQQSQQILSLLKILEKFLDHPNFNPPKQILNESFESALLPILESSLRGGSLLEISKYAQLFQGQLEFIRVLAKKKSLVPLLIQIPKQYVPKQLESIQHLLKGLQSTSKIFISCLTGSVTQKTSQQIAKNIIQTYETVQDAISHYREDHIDEESQKKILELPLTKKYPILLKDLRFDYIDMKDKTGKMKHHYSSYYTAKHTPPATKTIRLAQQLADLSHALPTQHTNAIFVRCDKQRVDYMQALIMGSNGTPYAHGAFLFDIYFQDTYPNNPPKVNLTTTGSGKIRFNPNLYACGKVCLSLLGTWRGNAMENWDSKISTLLQILISIQAITMSQEIYFNEPGFEHEQGTVEGQKKNQAYSNIVRYGNIKFAMIQNLKNPPKGFETIIKRHFYLKKDQILEECKRWLKHAEKRQASYTGLISDHNHSWCNQFKKNKTQYKTMLEKAVAQLQIQLNKLQQPSSKDLKPKDKSPKKDRKKIVKMQSKDADIEEIDVTYDQQKKLNYKELDINDEKVKDRWSRYIGAMGIEAVSKQSKASIFLYGLGALGIQIAKNIVLSGCKKIGLCDHSLVTWNDLSGQFFVGQDDIGKNKVQASIFKLQQLNHYVRVENINVNFEDLSNLKEYDVIIGTSLTIFQQIKLNQFSRNNKSKFINVDCYGPYGQLFNDFGQQFQVVDKNGEETVQVLVQKITNEEEGVVTLLSGVRHPYEDGDAVRITSIKGMVKDNGESINGTLHKIKVINQHSFKIGDTTAYTPYQGNGLIRNMKIPINVSFKTLNESIPLINIDSNLEYYDFAKAGNNKSLHFCFRALSQFRSENSRLPLPWNIEDSQKLLQIFKGIKNDVVEPTQEMFVRKFSFTCSGTFAPLCAFFGGFTAQQAFKAITGKYMPVNQYFYTEFAQVIPDLPKDLNEWNQYVTKINYKQLNNRLQGLRAIIGQELLTQLQHCRVFVVGSGAIGCQLLKNYAMINLSTGEEKDRKPGVIVVTDPDHIQTSNLNRQFLFRQKHLQKPKSVTAAAAVAQMNKMLKGKIRARLDKVCQATKDVFSNQFFQSMHIVTNALDNIQARQYVDQRCVENKVALLQSGTLSSKGHVQVIIPYKTETYGSKADPAEDGQIPHCTLKMFPEQTLHCVEWARDLFGKSFTLKPKALNKLLQTHKTYVPNPSDIQMLEDSLKMLKKKPMNFDDCIFTATRKFYQFYRNDIEQLLYTYPLDAKTKDGKPFWKLPKRPPTPISEIEPQNKLHAQFLTTYAVLTAKIFNIPFPGDFRTEKRIKQIANQAAKIKIEPFVPSDQKAKEMSSQVNQSQNNNKQKGMEQEQSPKMEESDPNKIEGETRIFEQIINIIKEDEDLKVSAQEFQKDQDQNGHIDLIYSMANLRALNYKLQPMDWLTTKIKAGRITPALSTTTSCIAALQTIQLIKYIKKCPVDVMKNFFINLAVPMVQAGEPGQIQKIKIHKNLVTNIWQRWQIGPMTFDNTLADLINTIQKKYDITVKTINLAEGGQIFSDIVLGLESKKQQKEQLLKKNIKELIMEEIPIQDIKDYIDFLVVLAVDDIYVKHVPTIRLHLKK